MSGGDLRCSCFHNQLFPGFVIIINSTAPKHQSIGWLRQELFLVFSEEGELCVKKKKICGHTFGIKRGGTTSEALAWRVITAHLCEAQWSGRPCVFFCQQTPDCLGAASLVIKPIVCEKIRGAW